MKKFLLSSAALFALGASAMAADLPARSPAAAPAPILVSMNWSGLYVGAQAGYLWSDNDLRVTARGRVFESNPAPNAFSIGAQAGYRHQYANGIVIGVEGDLSWLKGPLATGNYMAGAVAGGALGVNEHNWDASARLQLGYSMGRFLPYITGGVSFLNENGCAARLAGAAVCLAQTAFSSTRTGWTAGAGIAYSFTNNIVAHAEYRYADYGAKTYVTPALPSNTTSELKTSKAVVGLSWKFGGASPVVARY